MDRADSGLDGVTGAEIVAHARGWIGTPYLHQAACKGAGCDCLGLIRGVWAEVTGKAHGFVPPYTQDWSEPQGDEVLWRAATHLLTEKPVPDARAGDVILFRMRSGSVAKHLGIQTILGEAPRFVHAYSGLGVVESALTLPWQRRIVARFAFAEGSD